MQLRKASLAALTTITLSASASAQTIESMGTGRGGSPHERATWKLGAATIVIEYGRPFLKGRADTTLMEPGKPWRTGADAATVIKTDKPLTFGTITLAPGTYTINTVPGKTEWKLLLGKLGAEGQWGVPYKPELEIGSAPMTLARNASPVEQVTISIDGGANPVLHVKFGSAHASVPFKIGS